MAGQGYRPPVVPGAGSRRLSCRPGRCQATGSKKSVCSCQLKDQYDAASLIGAIRKAMAHKAYGADYIENILHQGKCRQKQHPPVKLKMTSLNNIRLPEPSLADYDALYPEKEERRMTITSNPLA